MHQYHCPNSSVALWKLLERVNLIAPLVPFQIPLLSTNVRSASPPSSFILEDVMEEEDVLPSHFDDDTGSVASHQNLPFELMDEHRSAIPGETHSVIHSVEQRVHVELLHLLSKAECPDYLFKEIIDWSARAQSMRYNFCPRISSRQAVLSDLQQHFNTQNLRPSIKQLKLESISVPVPIVFFDLKKKIISFLTDTKLMQPENLVINDAVIKPDGSIDVSPWFEPYTAPVGSKVFEVLSGRWYKDTVANTEGNNLFICPLILYVDKTFIDPNKSRFNLEPLNVSFALFKQTCRLSFEFWKTIGYVPDAPDSVDSTTEKGYKARNYHTMLEFLLQDLIEIHTNPEIFDNFPLRIGNHVKVVNLRFPVAFIISDTQGADKLCGRYLNYKQTVQRLHRTCLCPPVLSTSTVEQCVWVQMDNVMNAIDSNEKEPLFCLSQHYIPDHAFRYIDFGSNSHGIFAATPNDYLHGIKLGVIHYLLDVFLNQELNVAARLCLDQSLKQLSPHFKQGGSKQFPRLYFPNGVTSIKNCTADENVGIMFVLYLLIMNTQCRQALVATEKISIARLNEYVKVFNNLLVFLMWLSSPNSTFWQLQDARSHNRASRRINSLMDLITNDFNRKKGQGWNISKMHELTHITRLIDMFGSPANYDTGPCERMH